jgi:hypothetical protein
MKRLCALSGGRFLAGKRSFPVAFDSIIRYNLPTEGGMSMKFIPREKLSKKAKRALDGKRRATWEGLNPVTKQTANRKAYDRKRPARFDEDRPGGLFHL